MAQVDTTEDEKNQVSIMSLPKVLSAPRMRKIWFELFLLRFAVFARFLCLRQYEQGY
jgi:hypothetical protein